MTTAERLVEVQAAISAVLVAGQEYQINGRRFRRADLSELRKMEADIKGQLAAESTDGMRAYVAWGGRG